MVLVVEERSAHRVLLVVTLADCEARVSVQTRDDSVCKDVDGV